MSTVISVWKTIGIQSDIKLKSNQSMKLKKYTNQFNGIVVLFFTC